MVSGDRLEAIAKIANFLAQQHIWRSEAARLKRMKAVSRWLQQQA